MTPLVFGSAGMFTDAAAPPSSVIKSRRFNLIEQHSVSHRQGRVAGYRIGRDHPSLFTTRCSLTDAQSPFGINRVISAVRRPLPVHPDERT